MLYQREGSRERGFSNRQAIVYLVFPGFKNFISDIPDSGPFNVSTFTQLRLEERLIISMRNKTSL